MGGPLVVLAVLPDLFQRFSNPQNVSVRGVDHRIYGASCVDRGVNDAVTFRQIAFHCIFLGAHLNSAEFGGLEPPEVPLELEKEGIVNPQQWRFDPRVDACDWLLPPPAEGAYAKESIRGDGLSRTSCRDLKVERDYT